MAKATAYSPIANINSLEAVEVGADSILALQRGSDCGLLVRLRDIQEQGNQHYRKERGCDQEQADIAPPVVSLSVVPRHLASLSTPSLATKGA